MVKPKSNNSNNNLFPCYLELKKVNDSEYILEPTPESIALCDYIIQNAVYNGIQNYDVSFNPGELYINNCEIEYINFIGNDFNMNEYDGYISPYINKILGVKWPVPILIIGLGRNYPKGYFSMYNDD